MSVSFYGYVCKSAEHLWTFPEGMREHMSADADKPAGMSYDAWYDMAEHEANPLYDPRIDCNLSNSNAREVMHTIGIDMDESAPIPVEKFINLVAVARRNYIGKPSPSLVDVIDAVPGQPTFIHCGRREGYVEETLKRFSELAQAAKEYGASHIGWS
jgi:hypothetical protein